MQVERTRKMILNTLLLTAASFLMRAVSLAFQVYLSNRIGSSGIGLFQLIMAVSILAATFAISGIRFATTRLVSEELGRKNPAGAKAAVYRCILYAVIFGTAALLILFFSADFIGTKLICDVRTVQPLRILSLGLPALAVSAVLGGYFTAVCRVIKSAAVQIIEQFIWIAVVVLALTFTDVNDLSSACSAVILGSIVGEIISCGLLYILYIFDRRKLSSSISKPTRGLTQRMVRIAIPLAFSAYARAALSTLQNLLVPRGLRKSGISAETALSDYGMIQGMVFPIITFPAALFISISELIVPELTDAQVKGQYRKIDSIVNRSLRLCLLFSVGAMCITAAFSGNLGLAIYKNDSIGRYIFMTALLMPIMYLDTVTDGMLRGLGQHMYSMRYNVWDSLISVVLVYVLLPKYAVAGYIFILYFTEIFNFSLSIYRLSKVTHIKFPIRIIVVSTLCAVGAVSFSILFLRIIGLGLSAHTAILLLHIAVAALIYVLLLSVCGCIDYSDTKRFKEIFGSTHTRDLNNPS
jgi:stage V sporulation protein B